MKGTLWLFRTKDYIRREGCKECFYIQKVVLFFEGKSFPQFKICWHTMAERKRLCNKYDNTQLELIA